MQVWGVKAGNRKGSFLYLISSQRKAARVAPTGAGMPEQVSRGSRCPSKTAYVSMLLIRRSRHRGGDTLFLAKSVRYGPMTAGQSVQQ